MFEKTLVHESTFHIAVLNGAFLFHSVKAIKNWRRSATIKLFLLNGTKFDKVCGVSGSYVRCTEQSTEWGKVWRGSGF